MKLADCNKNGWNTCPNFCSSIPLLCDRLQAHRHWFSHDLFHVCTLGIQIYVVRIENRCKSNPANPTLFSKKASKISQFISKTAQPEKIPSNVNLGEYQH